MIFIYIIFVFTAKMLLLCSYVRAGSYIRQSSEMASAIDRTDLCDVIRFLASDSFGVFTATKWASVADGTLAFIETITVADISLASRAAKCARAFALGKPVAIYNAFTIKAVIVAEGNFANGSGEPAKPI